jgi:membrane protease YdiL (CAAX protease family)
MPVSRTRRFFALAPVRLVFAVLLTVAFGFAGLSLLRAFGTSDTLLYLRGVLLLAAAVAALALTGKALERKPLADIGLGMKGGLRDLFLGFAVGFALLAAVIGVLAALGWYRVESLKPPADMLRIGATMALVLLPYAAWEEVFFRGIVFRIVEDWLGTWVGIVASALFFGFAHATSPNATVLTSSAIAVEAGILLSVAFVRTRTLWLAIGIHWGWNFTQGPLFGAAVSGARFDSILTASIDGPATWTGGPFGPEGGWMALGVCGLTGVALAVQAHRRGDFLLPSWKRRPPVQPATAEAAATDRSLEPTA